MAMNMNLPNDILNDIDQSHLVHTYKVTVDNFCVNIMPNFATSDLVLGRPSTFYAVRWRPYSSGKVVTLFRLHHFNYCMLHTCVISIQL